MTNAYMTNTQPPIRYDIWCIYSLYAFAVLAFGGSLFAAGFLPPWDPTWEASKITEIYQKNHFGIQIGMMMLMLGCALYLPFCAITSELIEKRMGMPVLAKIQLSVLAFKLKQKNPASCWILIY